MNEDKSRRAFLVSMAASVAAASAMPDGLAASRVAGEGDPQTAARGDAGQAAVAQASDPVLKFAVIGLNHGHINAQTNAILGARGELAWVYAKEGDLVEAFRKQYPQAKPARSEDEVLEDPSVKLVVSAAIPDERAPLGIRVMRHGKDYMADKPGVTTLEQLAEVRRVQAETKRIYSIMYSERLENRATVKAGELVKAGAIGRVLQTVGLGPHRMNAEDPPGVVLRAGAIRRHPLRHRVAPGRSVPVLHRLDEGGGGGVAGRQPAPPAVPGPRGLRRRAACAATAAPATSASTGSRRTAWPPGATAG